MWKVYDTNGTMTSYLVEVVNWATFETTYIRVFGLDKLLKTIEELSQRTEKDRRIDFHVFKKCDIDWVE